jgi:hypothetical protein
VAAVILVLGLLQAWAGRHSMQSDGISYLDMGDAIVRGDWRMALNGYWSPLYPFLLGACERRLEPRFVKAFRHAICMSATALRF